jgi:hypothetical protein
MQAAGDFMFEPVSKGIFVLGERMTRFEFKESGKPV